MSGVTMNLIKATQLSALLLIGTGVIHTNPVYAGADPQNIAINEVYYLGNNGEDWVELINRGPDAVDISGWLWCARFSYPGISVTDIISGTGNGDLLIEPGEIIALSIGIDLNDTSSDLGLYTQSPFGLAVNMVDFVQWGTDVDVGRSDVGRDKDIWLELSTDSYDFVPTATNNQTLSWCGGESGGGFLTTSLDLANATATQGAANSLICDGIFFNGFE